MGKGIGKYVVMAVGVIGGLCTVAPLAMAQQQATPLTVKPLKKNVYWAFGGALSNNGIIIGKNDVILVDTKQTVDEEKEVIAEIAKLTPKKVTTVILTHSDGDHVNGLAAFPQGLTIIAQENCKKEMEATLNTPRPAPRDYMPTKTVDKKESLTIDGVRLELLHFAPAHTTGDLIVYLPKQKIVFTGDLITPDPTLPLPVIHLAKHGTSEGWIESAKGMVALNADIYVSGHGPLQTKAQVQKILALAEEKRDKVKAMVAQGKSLDEVKQALDEPIPPVAPGGAQYPPFQGYNEVVYQELTKK